MKTIEARNGFRFRDHFVMFDGSFACLEVEHLGLDGAAFQVLNLSTGERYARMVSETASMQVVYSSSGMVLIYYRPFNETLCYDLLTFKRLKKDKFLTKPRLHQIHSSNLRKTALELEEEKCITGANNCLFLANHVNWLSRTGNSKLVCTVMGSVERMNKAKVRFAQLVGVCRNDGSDLKFFDVGFAPSSILMSPDGYTAMACSQFSCAIIDLDY